MSTESAMDAGHGAPGGRGVTSDRFTVRAEDGFALAAARWLPEGAPRAVLVVVHGMAEHMERYAGFAAACAQGGLAVLAYDHRGHGASIDDVTPHGHYADVNGWSRVVGDLETVAVRRIKGWDANWTPPDAALSKAWQRAATVVRGAPSPWAIRLPASDASRWRRAGVPALCYGPQPTWSAGIDDHAVEDEVVRCAALYALTALDVLRAG